MSSNYSVMSSKQKTAFVFMILGIILTCICDFFIYPWLPLLHLAIGIPMTIYYYQKAQTGISPVGTGFKVCTLLFVSFIAGIIMLTDD